MFSRVLMSLVLFSAVSYGSDQKRTQDDFAANLRRAFSSKDGIFSSKDGISYEHRVAVCFQCGHENIFIAVFPKKSIKDAIENIYNKGGTVLNSWDVN